MSSFEIHNDFNELDFILKKSSSEKDLFDMITREIFGDNLLFAIIETTTIGDVSGVGTSQYIAHKPYEYIQEVIHKDYFDIIQTVKSDKFGGPSKYINWYRRDNSYYVIGKNRETEKSFEGKLNSEILPPYEKDKTAEQYISDYVTPLTEETIRSFFNLYVDSLLEKEWFRELPNYFVLVKPLSVKDDSAWYIPLGNLYVKIGTKTTVELETYQKYVTILQTAWFKKYGAKMLQEFSKKRTSDEYKPKYTIDKDMGKRFGEPLFTISGRPIMFHDLFQITFDSEEYRACQETEGYLLLESSELIKELIKKDPTNKQGISDFVRSIFKDYSENDPANFIKANKDGLVKLNGIGKECVHYFLQLLSLRRLALMLLFVYDMTFEEVHSCITYGERGKSKSPSISKYFRENTFVYKKNRKLNVELLAEREEKFLQNTFQKIQKNFPNFSSTLFK